MTRKQKAWLALVALALAGAMWWALTTDTLDAQPRRLIVDASGKTLTRWFDNQYGVVCYSVTGGVSATTIALSCVRRP